MSNTARMRWRSSSRLSERYERKADSTNLVFSDWIRIFKSPLTTMAAIDRVVHHSVVLDLMPVESFRAQTAVEQQRQHHPTSAATVTTAATREEAASA